MRRILTTLMILLAVIVVVTRRATQSSLISRAYMVHEGGRARYQLDLDGPLRWHVWPQLSILSGRMTPPPEAPEEPVIRADNAPRRGAAAAAFSHQLQVKQVISGARRSS